MKPRRKTAAKKKSTEEYIRVVLRTARKAFEALQRQPKMTTEEMREQVRRNELEWERNRYK